MREMARIQTFPDDVQILGGVSMVQRQLGNAVPSLLAEVLGREIRKQLFGQRISVTNLKLLPPDRNPAPSAEPVFKVKQKYKPVQASERSLRDEKQV